MRAQIEIGCREFERHFGKRPQGIWLPECGYIAGRRRAAARLRHPLLLHRHARRPVRRAAAASTASTPRSSAPRAASPCLARDTESSKQVWSAIEGYPGDYDYREFYRDVGFDLDYDYLKPHLHQTGIRSHTRHQVLQDHRPRPTHKEPYDPQAALEKAAEHAGNFMFNREKQVEWLAGAMDGRPSLIVAPYDAELFGHWWFEGPDWINFLFRKMHCDQQTVKTITVPEYLDRHPKIQVAQPSMSSWGYKGYCEVWLEGSNDWIYRHLHEDADRMVELARQHPDRGNAAAAAGRSTRRPASCCWPSRATGRSS